MYDIPLPRVIADVEAGGPYVTAAKGLNALRKIQAEAKYAPYTEYANALSKSAYAQTAPAAALATFMSGTAAGNLSREQVQALAERMQNSLGQSNMAGSIPAPNNSFGGNSLAGDVIGNLIKYLSGKTGVPQQNQLTQPSSVSQQSISSPETVSQAQGTGTAALPFNRQAGRLPLPGTQGGNTPATGAKAQEAAIIKGTEEEVAAQSAMWSELHKEAAKSAISAQSTVDLANEFSDAYDRTSKWEKGPIKGSVPSWFSEAAHTADTASNGMGDAVARAQQQGHITQNDRVTYQSMKPNRGMRPETKENAIAFIKGMNQRTQEHAAFLVAAQKKGLTPQEANTVWIDYIKKNPFYSAKEHQLIETNFNRWPEYLSNEKIDEALNPSPESKNVSSNEKNKGSKGADILSKGLVIPKFISKKEGLAWFNRQPEVVKSAIRKHLGEK